MKKTGLKGIKLSEYIEELLSDPEYLINYFLKHQTREIRKESHMAKKAKSTKTKKKATKKTTKKK